MSNLCPTATFFCSCLMSKSNLKLSCLPLQQNNGMIRIAVSTVFVYSRVLLEREVTILCIIIVLILKLGHQLLGRSCCVNQYIVNLYVVRVIAVEFPKIAIRHFISIRRIFIG